MYSGRWQIMPKLIIKSGREAGREVELKEGVNRIGRSPGNDIEIQEPSISGVHCELQVAEIGVSVRDLGSTNGTFINGKQVAKGILQRGDTLMLGEIEFTPDLPEVHIAVPKIEFQESLGAAFLEDGTPACFNHRDMGATFRCGKCEQWWCNECVRLLKRLNGEFLKFCPDCSGPCIPLQEVTATSKKSFFGRLGDTLRVTRKK
jgi:hypothetical protein